jgi:hypothetical protein
MANLIRSARSGSNWGTNELIAFNIIVDNVDAQTFFGSPNLPQITVSAVILDNLEEPTGTLQKSDMVFFAYMEDAMAIPAGEESSVDDFAAFLLKMLSYDEGRRVIVIYGRRWDSKCVANTWMPKQTFALWSVQFQV